MSLHLIPVTPPNITPRHHPRSINMHQAENCPSIPPLRYSFSPLSWPNNIPLWSYQVPSGLGLGHTHRSRCTHNAVHTQGSLWPPQGLCHLSGVRGLAPALSKASRSKGWFGSPHTRQCIHKVVHTQGGAHTRRYMATAGALLYKGGAGAGPRFERSEPKQGVVWRSTHNAVHTQVGTHTRRCMHNAVCGHHKSLVISGGCGGWPLR